MEGRHLTAAAIVRAAALFLAAATVAAATVAAATVAGAAGAPPPAPPPLPALGLAAAGVTVSGVSSGGYMAHQLHVAHAASIDGAGVVAGGPYACAGGGYPWNLGRAMAVCMRLPGPLPWFGPPQAERSLRLLGERAAAGLIDDPAALAGARVYLFSGADDALVPAPVVAAVGQVYAAFLGADRLRFESRVAAAHAMVTLRWGNACGSSRDPFINDCDFDLASAILDHLQPPPAAGTPATAAAAIAEADGDIRPFDQRPFFPAGREAGMAMTGYLYIPAACRSAAEPCRLHVAFHGCNQDAGRIGDAFVRHAGYNHAGDRHRTVILYPQTRVHVRHVLGLPIPWPNPQACWDWWGYTGADYATRSGPQIVAVKQMIDRLTAPMPPP